MVCAQRFRRAHRAECRCCGGSRPTRQHRLIRESRPASRASTSSSLPTSIPTAKGAEFQLPAVARNLPGVSVAVPQSGHSGRRYLHLPSHGGCCHPRHGRLGRRDSVYLRTASRAMPWMSRRLLTSSPPATARPRLPASSRLLRRSGPHRCRLTGAPEGGHWLPDGAQPEPP